MSLLGDRAGLGKGRDWDKRSVFDEQILGSCSGSGSLNEIDGDAFGWRESGSKGVCDGVCNGAGHKL